MSSFNQAPFLTLGHSLTNLRQELKILIESCIPLETQTTHTDRCKPLGQKPGQCRVLELYIDPAFAQVVWRDLYKAVCYFVRNHPRWMF